MNKKNFLMLLPLALSGVVGMANSSEISIFPGQAEQEVKFGADIKLTLKRVDEGNTGRIMDRFIEMGIDMVRVPIYATRDITDPFYDRVYRVADIAEDKGLTLFASVANGDGDLNGNLHGEVKFSDDLKCNSGCNNNIYRLNFVLYSTYLDTYLQNMELNDAAVSYLGPYNEDQADNDDYRKLWDKMDHSNYSRVGAEFWGLERSVEATPDLLDQIDVVGSHFYDDIRIAPEDYDSTWADLTDAASGAPVWFTESTRYQVDSSEMTNTRSGIEHMIPAIRGGAERVFIYQTANRLVWYNGGKRAYRFSATKQFTSNATGNVVDSSSDDLAIKTVSFIDNDHLKINITNGDTSAKVTTINLQGDYSSLGSGEQALWTESVEGELTGISFDDVSCWTMTVPANSYLQLNVPVQATQGQPSTECVHIPLPQDSALPDFDNDGIANFFDEDDDNDDVLDANDAFPFDSTESLDTDGDGIGNNADVDDDGDSVLDTDDAFPLDSTESIDTDGDGIGNSADTDDDNDGVDDAVDYLPLDAEVGVLGDLDGDHDIDAMDIQAFLRASLNGALHSVYDLNNDGQADHLDIPSLVRLCTNENCGVNE